MKVEGNMFEPERVEYFTVAVVVIAAIVISICGLSGGLLLVMTGHMTLASALTAAAVILVGVILGGCADILRRRLRNR